MAEVTAFRNNALPYPVYGVPWTVVFPMLDVDGDPVTGITCDSEVSKNGDTAVDCTNEGTEIPFDTATNKGMYYLTLTAAEMTADVVTVTVYSGSEDTQATCIVLYPRKLVSLLAGTSAGGDTAYITLPAAGGVNDDTWNGCLCVATIDSNVEARIITDYTGSNQRAAVTPAWNVAPDDDDTFIIYLPEGMQRPMADMNAIKGVVLTETSDGYLAAAFKKLFDVETPVLTGASVNQTGDSYPLALETHTATVLAADTGSYDLADNPSELFNIGIADNNFDWIVGHYLLVWEDGEATNISMSRINAYDNSIGFVTLDPKPDWFVDSEEYEWIVLPGAVGSTLADGAITSAKFATDAIAAAAVKADAVTKIQSGLATTGADSDTLETLSDQIDALENLSAAEAEAAADAALATYDAPTKTELDTAQGVITDAIAALENISAAEVNTEVDTALSDYDPPTKAELDAAQGVVTDAIAALENLSAADAADAVWDEDAADHVTAGSMGASLGALAPDMSASLTYTLTTTGDVPCADALVEAYTDEAMTEFVTSGRTDDNGVVVLYGSAGVKYLKRIKAGVAFVNPDTETFA